MQTDSYHTASLYLDQERPTYWLTRFLILRLLGLIYAIGFLVAINQEIPLFGSSGLLPIGPFLSQVKDLYGSTTSGFVHLPSIFWMDHSDSALLAVAWSGLALSCIVVAGFANVPLLAVLWFLYMSIVHVGQDWYGYGWEIQLLETGFLAIFLCPLIEMRPFPKQPPPFIVIVLFRWLIFRIMLGSGLIKMRGDEIWQNATALYYHFETQPIPGPLSRWFHFLPHVVLKMGVWFNWVAELVAPFFVFWPRRGRWISGLIIVSLQLVLIASGNLSFLNWLTLLPALACFEDRFWAKLLPGRLIRKSRDASRSPGPSRRAQVISWTIALLIAVLSIQPVLNMLSSEQIMNTSFDPFEIVNTYGAFGSVGRERLNVVFEGTRDDTPDDNAHWIAYPYKGLPTAIDKRPPQIAPYQWHLDWQMWFASMSTPDEYPWTYHLVWKLLHGDPDIVGLFASDPFKDKPPRYIRAALYRYQFVKPGQQGHDWWKRERAVNLWLTPVSVDDAGLKAILDHYGWLPKP